ncbi:hypothetical protein [Kutzneria buriramensis]|uniref:Uncharacterized protein n=1 Tax=Kutzneria buriramensis TaxID=1045776 RepID=A0A3E0GUM2_9PSEU|nr:hypothetical protein [Kutzneria buriramensis]REH25988.1 hypothetical protein BCF44_13527 [Kutzneria buriramensis]
MSTSYVPTERVDLDQLTAVVDAVRAGHSTLAGSGLTSSVAAGEARERRDHRTAARTAPTQQPAPTAATAEATRLPRRLRPRRRAPLPVRPGVLPTATH